MSAPLRVGFLATATLFLSSSFVHAQEELPEYKSATANIIGDDPQWMKIFPVGDSVLLLYVVYNANVEFKRACWLTRDGNAHDFELDTEVFAVNRYGGDTYYYVLEEKKKKLFLTAIIDHADGTRTTPPETIPIEGDVIDEFVDKNHFIVLHNSKEKMLIEMELNRMSVVKMRAWDLPEAIYDQVDRAPFTLMKEGSFYNSFLGTSKVKLYRDGAGKYTVTADAWHTVRPNKPLTKERTTGTHILRVGDTTTQVIPYKGDGDFRSFYMQGMIFRYNINKKSTNLEVIDVATGEKLAGEELLAADNRFNIYDTQGNSVRISEYHQITKTSTHDTDPLIIASQNADGSFLVTTGSKRLAGTTGPGVIVGIAFGLTGYLVYTLATSTLNQGFNLYYYSTFDPISGEIKRVPFGDHRNVRAVTDRYQFKLNNIAQEDSKKRVTMHGYSENKDHVVGFYYYPRRPERVEVVWFPRE